MRGPTPGNWAIHCAVLAALAWYGGMGVEAAWAEQAGKDFQTEVVAVLDLNAQGAKPAVALAASIRLREELLHSGFFSLVDRQRLNKVLEEQALSQAVCTGADCTVRVGKITGARIIMTGDLIQLSDDSWQISAIMTDVETSQVLRSGSVIYEGSVAGLIEDGIPGLAARLVPKGDPAKFGGVVNFLSEMPGDLVEGAASHLLGVERDKTTGNLTLRSDTQLRFWVAPASYFRFGIRSSFNQTLERLLGFGISLGMERELEKSWAAGLALHLGTLEKRKELSGASNLILGYYTAFSIYALDAVPNGKPWFYYGTGLMGYSLNYVDSGENLNASGGGVLLMGRMMYTFKTGAVAGLGVETNYLYSLRSKSTRVDQYDAAGESVSDQAWIGVGYLFFGYTF